jgi:hypothetical protein
MKNQYVGDIGDYGKYGLLRFLANRGIRIGVFCKPFLQEVAKRFCRLLHLHFVGDCRRLCRPELAGRAPSQTSFTVTV